MKFWVLKWKESGKYYSEFGAPVLATSLKQARKWKREEEEFLLARNMLKIVRVELKEVEK